ncbi:MAG: ATP-binding protein [Pontixanthobacter sp.]
MQPNSALPPLKVDTVTDLRELYRAAESRAARMRLLSVSGREFAAADPETIDAILQKSAMRIAFFLGKRSAGVRMDGVGPGKAGGPGGIAIYAPGSERRPLAQLVIDGVASAHDIADPEDREAFQLHLELMGATIDRIERERERAALLAALREREKRLETMVGTIFSAQEEERLRVSQELHDGVAQTATGLARILEGAGTSAAGGIAARDRTRLAGIARDLVRELRAVIGGLRPTLLDDLGLVPALQSLAEGLGPQGYRVTMHCNANTARFAPHVETALFRVAQEALANVRKHAGGPCSVRIELQADDHARRFMRIADTGCGATMRDGTDGPINVGSHIGIDVMRERMGAIGGSLEWRSEPEAGVTVTAWLPEKLA